jgi:hypothetical protein
MLCTLEFKVIVYGLQRTTFFELAVYNKYNWEIVGRRLYSLYRNSIRHSLLSLSSHFLLKSETATYILDMHGVSKYMHGHS